MILITFDIFYQDIEHVSIVQQESVLVVFNNIQCKPTQASEQMERETGYDPATCSLENCHSTN